MLVTIVVSARDGGGAEFVARTWASGLIQMGHTVRLITLEDLDGGQGARRWSQHGQRLIAIRRLMLEMEPSFVLGVMTYQNLLALAGVASIPRRRRPICVISEHSIETLLSRDQGGLRRLQYWLARLAYRRADLVVGPSHAVAGELIGGYGVSHNRVAVVPNPALAKIEPRPPRAFDVGRSVTLVVPGRMDDPKNPVVAVEVAAVLRQRGWTPRVLYFGRGEHEATCRVRAQLRDIPVHVAGWQDDWFAQCPNDSVVLLASSYEGFGNVLVEAAASGIPSVAASSALGVADALVHGVTGVLAPSSSIDDLTDAAEEARRLRIPDVAGWLQRFSTQGSADALWRATLRVARDMEATR